MEDEQYPEEESPEPLEESTNLEIQTGEHGGMGHRTDRFKRLRN